MWKWTQNFLKQHKSIQRNIYSQGEAKFHTKFGVASNLGLMGYASAARSGKEGNSNMLKNLVTRPCTSLPLSLSESDRHGDVILVYWVGFPVTITE